MGLTVFYCHPNVLYVTQYNEMNVLGQLSTDRLHYHGLSLVRHGVNCVFGNIFGNKSKLLSKVLSAQNHCITTRGTSSIAHQSILNLFVCAEKKHSEHRVFKVLKNQKKARFFTSGFQGKLQWQIVQTDSGRIPFPQWPVSSHLRVEQI